MDVLLVIDAQPAFAKDCSHGNPAQVLREHIDEQHYERIVLTLFEAGNDNFKQRLDYSGPNEPELCGPLKPLRGREHVEVRTKRTYSALHDRSTRIDLEGDTIHLAGMDVGGCVLATAFDAFDHGLSFQLVEPHLFTSGDAHDQQAAWRIIRRHLL